MTTITTHMNIELHQKNYLKIILACALLIEKAFLLFVMQNNELLCSNICLKSVYSSTARFCQLKYQQWHTGIRSPTLWVICSNKPFSAHHMSQEKRQFSTLTFAFETFIMHVFNPFRAIAEGWLRGHRYILGIYCLLFNKPRQSTYTACYSAYVGTVHILHAIQHTQAQYIYCLLLSVPRHSTYTACC